MPAFLIGHHFQRGEFEDIRQVVLTIILGNGWWCEYGFTDLNDLEIGVLRSEARLEREINQAIQYITHDHFECAVTDLYGSFSLFSHLSHSIRMYDGDYLLASTLLADCNRET
jgi:hypothetical protein